nr:uncharacterized protein LOC115263652 [Aedes albopictus]
MPEDNDAPGSGDLTCMLCEDHESVDDMVQCDNCDQWAHYTCAGVTEAVKESQWVCTKCTNTLQVPKNSKKVPSKKTGKKTSNKSDTGSESGKVDAIVASFEESLAQLQYEKSAKVKQLDEEKVLHEKRLQMERELLEKKRLQKRQMQEKELAQEQEVLEQQLRDEQEFLQRRQELRSRFQKLKLDLSQQYEEHDETDDEEEGAAGVDRAKTWLDTVKDDPRGAYPKKCGGHEPVLQGSHTKPSTGNNLRNVNRELPRPTMLNEPGIEPATSSVQRSLQNPPAPTNVSREWDELLHRSDLTAEEQLVIRNIRNRRRPEDQPQGYAGGRGPTPEQLARGKVGTPLRNFTDFINDIVSEVSEVADFTGAEHGIIGQSLKSKPKKKEFVNTHNAQPNRPSGSRSETHPKPRKPYVVCKRNDHKLVGFYDTNCLFNQKPQSEDDVKYRFKYLSCTNKISRIELFNTSTL